jgi:hypothetical protein
MEESDVGFGDLALGEHFAQLAVGAVVFGDEDEAAGVLVEAVDDAGAEVAAYVGEFVEVEEEDVDEGAMAAGVGFAGGCEWGGAGSGVDHHAGGFVDDGEVLVFVEDFEGDVFGDGVEWGGLRGAFDLDGFAAVEFVFGLGGVAVDADLAGFDEELDTSSGDVGESMGEVLVETEVGGGRVGLEGADAGGVCIGIFFEVVEVDDWDWGRGGFFDAPGGAVLGFYGAAALAFGEHVLRRHGGPAFGVAGGG